MFRTVLRTVGNRELILGIDHLYRDAMKAFEIGTLLPAAEAVALHIGADPGEVPIEGYYAESPELARYFQLMRALQQVPAARRDALLEMDAFQQLWRATQSPLFGADSDADILLPPKRDPLYFALKELSPAQWSIPQLTEKAAREAALREDHSLVGLACLARDAVCIAALRESVVLYAELYAAMAARSVSYRYVWKVTPEVAAAANRFITGFNQLTSACFPSAVASNVEYYYFAASNSNALGRCARIGYNALADSEPHYHWAVNWGEEDYVVEDFWKGEIWTTERYRVEKELY